MAKNFVQNGSTVEFTASGAVLSGDVVVIGGLVGVAIDDVADTETGVAVIDGVWELPKTASGAIDQGASIDYDVSAGEFAIIGTAASGDLVDCGVVVEAAADGDTTVLVKINQHAATITA